MKNKKGSMDLEEAGILSTGDSIRLTAGGERKITADSASGAEVLIWEMGL